VQEAKFDFLGVFSYSKEEDTSSFSLGDTIKESVKNRRRDKIMEIQADISFHTNERYLNQQVDALIEGTSKDNPSVLIGRGKFQAPEVDSVILIETPDDWTNVVNTIQKVEITGRDVYDLYGQLAR
jgi:ribosomal protein S12 methylthiotransferase